MQLSSLSLIYIALCAFVAASVLVIHMNFADGLSINASNPFTVGQVFPAQADLSASAFLWTRASAIEM